MMNGIMGQPRQAVDPRQVMQASPPREGSINDQQIRAAIQNFERLRALYESDYDGFVQAIAEYAGGQPQNMTLQDRDRAMAAARYAPSYLQERSPMRGQPRRGFNPAY